MRRGSQPITPTTDSYRGVVNTIDNKAKGKPGAAFERLTAAVHQKLDPGAEVLWDEWINGCQVDASIRGTIGGVPMLVIVECKDLRGRKRARVGKPVVDKLHSVRQQTGANKAIIVTGIGYSKPALKLAAEVGIDTCVLRPAESADVPGDGELLQRVTFNIGVMSTLVEDVEVELADGRRLALSAMDSVQMDDDQHAAIQDIATTWLDEEEGRRYTEGDLIQLAIEPTCRLLLDNETPVVRVIRCRARTGRLGSFLIRIWEAPEQWAFVQHRPDGVVAEPQFFQFDDLQRLADNFKNGLTT